MWNFRSILFYNILLRKSTNDSFFSSFKQIKLVWTCILLHVIIYATLFILFYLFPMAISSIGMWDTGDDSAIGGGYSVGGNIVACDNNKGKFLSHFYPISFLFAFSTKLMQYLILQGCNVVARVIMRPAALFVALSISDMV